MQPLNALDAIAPAFKRTQQTILEPFRVGRSWKLGAAAYVAALGGVWLPFPLLLLALPMRYGHQVFPETAILVLTLILLVIFYLGVRMQSVHFEMVVTRAKFIAPMWRRYGVNCWPWVGVKVAVGTVVCLAASPLILAQGRTMLRGLMALAPQIPTPAPGAQPDPVAVQQAMLAVFGLPFYATVIALFLLLKLVSSLVEDFALPFAILDEVAFPQAIRSGLRVIARDPLQAVLYLFMKFILFVLGFIAQTVVNQIVLIPAGIVGLILGAICGFIAYAAGAGHGHAAVPFIVGGVVGYGLIFVVTVWAQIFTLGYLLTLLEAYAIYFLGGRYQKLGDYLEPPTYTYAPPPLPPSPREDDDDGPDLPMNPALV